MLALIAPYAKRDFYSVSAANPMTDIKVDNTSVRLQIFCVIGTSSGNTHSLEVIQSRAIVPKNFAPATLGQSVDF